MACIVSRSYVIWYELVRQAEAGWQIMKPGTALLVPSNGLGVKARRLVNHMVVIVPRGHVAQAF